MAKKVWDKPIDKNIPWDGNQNTDNLPVCGYRIEEFIKSQLNSRIGILYYDITNNRYLAFSDTIDRDEYLNDPTKVDLILATFDAPFNYSAEITLQTPSYNAVFLNSTGNYIDFTFDIVNKQGASTGENVIISYTFIRNANKQVVTETRKFGDVVHFNIDKYLGEGTNTIIIGITGQTTLAATTTAVTYQVINLFLSDELNIAKSYNISIGPQQVEIPFTVSGYGTKIVEWYLDGELLDFVKSEDEVVDVITTRTKYITLSNLKQGSHSLQIRAYSVINGERFYTDTLYRDLLVYTGNGNNIIIGIATTIPREYGIIGPNDRVAIYEMVQYVPYTIRFATYSPLNAAATEIIVMLDAETVGSTISRNDIENEFVITSKTSGNRVLRLLGDTESKEVVVSVGKTSMNIDEIEGAIIDFTASGKNNESVDRDTWTNGVYTGTLTGFNWNNTSGWVNGRLEMNAGSSFAINYAPLNNNPTNTGKTIEIEWSTRNVTNDNAVICDLRESNGVGILITATKVSMVSADGVIVETEYKSDENVRIGFVINRSEGTTNRRLSFIYTNGIVSRAEQWAATDNYNSSKEIVFTATDEAEISLKSIRVYDTALSSDNMLNNFILYRDTISEMMEVYDRNDVYEEGTTTFSPDKMRNRLPVMIVTGDIPILENTSDKDEQIVVDIEYYNTQDPSKSFTMKNAAMRPQGTSSMGYPKKNFRIYTQKVANTELYDSNGILVENKLYSFRDKAQPVDCWCLKADYAESSGTHNTGIAKLWNDALYNAQIDGEYKFRTEAQRKAIENKYDYDVRTTIDGFPILLFYRPKANEDLIFIGKYNFNNDKSTEKVFGFTDIPGFDNSRMQCWEILNNGNSLALFTSTEGFDDNWSEAFESRYPDTKTPYTGDLKAFCEWMTNVSPEDFATQKWEHLDVYKMAAYWIYLMRHAAADQFVKNAMFTSEDGIHFYYILYDNDTINGLINSGYLRIKPTDGRQTVDDTGSYVFAGHDSRLWNLLEADEEFLNILSNVDNALYTAGISYSNTIKVFDEDQADKWVEKVYNQDAQYKYIGPYVEKGINNLFMLQGKRDLHRKWWLAKRFSIFDAKYVSGSYKSQAVEIKCLNGTEVGQQFTIKAGYPLDYGYGINNIPRSFAITLDIGESHEFTTEEVINIGDPLRIYGAPNIAEIDFSKMSDRLAVVTIANVYDDNLGTKLIKLILGNPDKINAEVSEISGLKQAIALEELDIQGMTKMISVDLSNQKYFKKLKAFGSNLSSASFAKGAPVEYLELPSSMRALSLEQLPLLDGSNIKMEDISNVQYISIKNCPNVSNDFSFVYDWYKTKTTPNNNCSLIIDNINWNIENIEDFIDFLSLKDCKEFSIKGSVHIVGSPRIDQIYIIRDILGETVFDPNAELYVDVPTVVQINAESLSMLDGSTQQLSAEVYPIISGTYIWEIYSREGTTIDNQGLLVVNETGNNEDVVVKCTFISEDGDIVVDTENIQVILRTYPDNVIIEGNEDPRINPEYTWRTTTENINGSYYVEWELKGDAANYWRIEKSNICVFYKKASMIADTTGTLDIRIRRHYDNTIVATNSLPINMPVVFPSDATIIGDINPANGDHTYTWSTSTIGVNGDIIAHWELSGAVTEYVAIKTQDNDRCVMEMLNTPTDVIAGTLTLTLRKAGDSSTLVTATKTLEAMLEGVIITKTSNPGVQAALYNAGLVANEGYSLKEEVEKITADQLQPGTSYSTSIFYAKRNNITSFDEFQYFTGVTKIKKYMFGGKTGGATQYKINSIILPPSITEIENYGFCYNKELTSIIIPEGVTKVGSRVFDNTPKLVDVYLPSTLRTVDSALFNYFNDNNVKKSVRIHITEDWLSFYWSQSSFTLFSYIPKIAVFCINGKPLNELVVPSNVSTISTNLFEGYGGTSVDLGEHELFLEGQVFANSSISQIKGGKYCSIKFKGSYAYQDCYAAFKDVNDDTTVDSICNIALIKHSNYTLFWEGFYTSYNIWTRIGTINVGETTFRLVSGAYYSDMTTSKTITLTQTGGIQDLTERLKIGYITLIVNSNKSDAQFRVDYIDINSGEAASAIVGVGSIPLPIKPSTSITVTAITEYEGLISSGVKTIKYESTANSVTIDYVEKTDIYIQHIDGTLYTTDEWTAGGFANDQANGVAVACASTSFVVAKENFSVAFGGKNTAIEGVPLYYKFSDAILDFDGKGNTEKIIASLTGVTDSAGIVGAPAAEACANYVFPNGKNGYMGSTGQFNVIKNNFSLIEQALTLIGGTKFFYKTGNYGYWMSTLPTTKESCVFNVSGYSLGGTPSMGIGSGGTTFARNVESLVRPFTDL